MFIFYCRRLQGLALTILASKKGVERIRINERSLLYTAIMNFDFLKLLKNPVGEQSSILEEDQKELLL